MYNLPFCYQMVNMKIRRPYSTATIWASGKITVTGATRFVLSYVGVYNFY